jgi:hypothetical protein
MFSQNSTLPIGGLFYLSSSPNSILNIKDLSVDNLTATDSIPYSGAINVAQGKDLVMDDSTFFNISRAQRGAGILGRLITNPVRLYNCSFSYCCSSNNGGAISFLNDISFEIIKCCFTACKSERGYGGALASSSHVYGCRNIYNCIFDSNAALDMIGLDIYDYSGYGGMFYDRQIVRNSSSTSGGDGEYILFAVFQV